jgi:hypothetical protein
MRATFRQPLVPACFTSDLVSDFLPKESTGKGVPMSLISFVGDVALQRG